MAHDEAVDNLVNQEVTRSMLEVTGCQVAVVENGKHAVEAAMATDFDLILMDCQMPEMDGFAASFRIRGAEKGKIQAASFLLKWLGSEYDRACSALHHELEELAEVDDGLQ